MLQYEKIIYGPGKSFSYREFREKYFPMPMHLHPEIEIMIVLEGHGKRFVNDVVDDFYPGDLVIIGESVPHFHLCDKIYYEPNDLYCRVRVVQFKRDIFPQEMEGISDFANIADLIRRSMYGVKFTSPPRADVVSRMMARIDSLSGIRRINTLLRLLDILARIKDYRLLSEYDPRVALGTMERDSVAGRIYDYLLSNFKDDISLGDIARHVNQNPTSLCRYFKRNTSKNIFDCLNEIRVGYACKLLANSDFTVSQIAFESGYHNLSHFNKQFRIITDKSPSEYRRLAKAAE